VTFPERDPSHRSCAAGNPICRAAQALWLLLLLSLPTGLNAQTADFAGDWQTFWRTGSAVLSLTQEGDRVTGTYQPEEGTVEGTVEGRLLRGTWSQPGATGRFVFALSADGQTLTGRFGNGEYWNGFRDVEAAAPAGLTTSNATPRDTLQSLLIATNAAIYEGNARALQRVRNLVTYAGGETSATDQARRRALLFQLLDMATLRLMDIPEAPEPPEATELRVAIGPVAVPAKTELTFQRDPVGRWRLVVPEEATLTAERDRLLAAMGYDSMADLDRARANSPRAALRDFVLGTKNWAEGGREQAMAAMDLSRFPERTHAVEGAIYADYLRRILARIGVAVWQEIPDDPDRSIPFVYFQHPVGNVAIARVAAPMPEDAEGAAAPEQWKIAADTLATAPALLEAMQDLPPVRELTEPEPLSSFFRTREQVRAAAPQLTVKLGYLERWQWLAFAAALGLAAAAVWLVAAVVRAVARVRAPWHKLASLALPLGLAAGSLIVLDAVKRLGMTQAGMPFVRSVAGMFLILAFAFLFYRLASLVGGWFLKNAQKTTTHMDEIAASLGTGLVKLAIVVVAIISVADVAGLPYEGVLAGLGVGGVAIAFAARDTVSNMMSGGVLMADRPFQRGDLIELDGTLATVEEVGLRSTRLRGLDDTLLHVPNSQLSDRIIANWGRRRRRKLAMTVGVTYDTPRAKLDRFVDRLRAVVLDQPDTDPEDVYVGLSAFGASSIDIDILCHLLVSSYGAQVVAQHQLIIDIIALAEELGVAFAFPTRTVHLAGPQDAAAELAAASTVS
jgi:MscS family membrane protein